jgi:hypothetical protein
MSPKPVSFRIRSATLIRIPMIENGAAMALALKLTHDYFTDFPAPHLGWTPPPIPADVANFIPCALLITDAHNFSTGENIGRVRFLRDVQGYDTDATYFDKEWILTPKSTGGR